MLQRTLVGLTLAVGWTAACAAPPAAPEPSPIRGVTISTHGIGLDWADEPTMRRTMEDLRSLGTNWITIHPYAGIRGDGTVSPILQDGGRHADDPLAHVSNPIRIARELGMKVFIKPHLAYWGSPFTWRGEIQFGDDAAAWDRFFTSYRDWIVDVAAASRGADGFAVGTELDGTLEHPTLDHAAAWGEIIEGVRGVYDGALTYASNWTDFERVPFWDALDVIGIQAYFPVAEEPAAGEAAIRQGWRSLRTRLKAFSGRHGRPIVLTELGYNRSDAAAVTPWEYAVGGTDADGTQQRCLKVALEEIELEPSILGAFLWKWFPEPRPLGRNFQLATPELRTIIRQRWSSD